MFAGAPQACRRALLESADLGLLVGEPGATRARIRPWLVRAFRRVARRPAPPLAGRLALVEACAAFSARGAGLLPGRVIRGRVRAQPSKRAPIAGASQNPALEFSDSKRFQAAQKPRLPLDSRRPIFGGSGRNGIEQRPPVLLFITNPAPNHVSVYNKPGIGSDLDL